MINKIRYWFYRISGGDLDYHDWYLMTHTDITFTRERDITELIRDLDCDHENLMFLMQQEFEDRMRRAQANYYSQINQVV